MTSNEGNSKEEEATVLKQPMDDIDVSSAAHEKITGRPEVVPGGSVHRLSSSGKEERVSTSTPANGIRSYTTTTAKLPTGLATPHFVHPRSDEMWITKDTPASALPEGWYHYDNGCRYGNAKIPHHDHEYERELQKHAGWTSEGQLDNHDHHMKSNIEKDAYEKCFLVYRAHIARTIDLSKWNKDNIKQHPAYEPEWPWALLPHPSEGWDAGFHGRDRNCTICEDYSR